VPKGKVSRSVSSGMLGILQARLGQQVTISFRADYIISEEGLMVRQGGVLIPDPSGAKNTFCLMNVIGPPEGQEESRFVGRDSGMVGMISFTPDVVALVGTTVQQGDLPDIPENLQGHLPQTADGNTGEGAIITP